MGMLRDKNFISFLKEKRRENHIWGIGSNARYARKRRDFEIVDEYFECEGKYFPLWKMQQIERNCTKII